MTATIINELDSINGIELSIKAINESPEPALQIPKDSVNKRKGSMVDASRLQLLLTWARETKDPYLQFHQLTSIESLISDICSYAPGLSAVRLCKGIRVGEHITSRRNALLGAAEKIKATDAFLLNEIISGRTIDMTCVSGAKRQYLSPLFSSINPPRVKDKDGMHSSLKLLFEKINRSDEGLIPESFMQACSIFTSELFQNTQEHAVTDHQNKPYDAHVEGLIVSWTNMEDRLYADDFKGHHLLQDYWDREATSSENDKSRFLRCLQLSFFDSGPGLASRATGRRTTELGYDEERLHLLNCLNKKITTKKQIGAGQGLPGVLKELQKIGGLIRIRSGRHSIFNCFHPDGDENVFDFHDWSEEPLGNVSGAVISLLVPLRRT